MAEVVGLVASVVGIAAFGAKLSLTLYEYGDTVVHARKQIDNIANEVTLCSSVLQHIGTVLETEEATYSPALALTTKRIIQECKDLFHEIRSKVRHRKRQRGKGIRRVQWLFDKPRATELKAELEGLKSTLMLMVQTVALARKASKSEEKSEQDVDRIKKELDLLKSLIIANHHTILDLQEAEREAASSLDLIPPYSTRPPVDHPGGFDAYQDALTRPNPPLPPTYEPRTSSGPGITTPGPSRSRPAYEGAPEEDHADYVGHPRNLGRQSNTDLGGPKADLWRDSPVVMIDPNLPTDDTNDPNKTASSSRSVSPDRRGNVKYHPATRLYPSPPLALIENTKNPSDVLPLKPHQRTTSRLLIQEVPSSYRPMASQPALLIENGYRSTNRPPSDSKQDTTSTIKLLLDKWTTMGPSNVAKLIEAVPKGFESDRAARNRRRTHRDTSRREASANANEDESTSDSDSDSDYDSDLPSGYATAGVDSDNDLGRPHRPNGRPGKSPPRRSRSYDREYPQPLPHAQPYEVPRYGEPSYAPYDPRSYPVYPPTGYPPYSSQPWKDPGSAGNDEMRRLEARLESQEKFFGLQIEKLKVDLKLEDLDRKAAEGEKKAAYQEAEREAALYAAKRAAMEAAEAAAEAAAAEEKRLSDLAFEAWKPSSGRNLSGDALDEYDILDLLTRNDRGGIVWSRGNNASLSLFVGPRKFLTVQFIPPSHLHDGEEVDKYTLIGKEWVRTEVLEALKYPFVEKDATFYEILRPLTFSQVRSLVRISFQLRKDSYTQMARSLMAERTAQLSSTGNDDDETRSSPSTTATPPSPDQLDDVNSDKPKHRSKTSSRQHKDRDRDRYPHATDSSREQVRQHRKT
ncbi:hypothetical protein MMC11_003580 [Xylographa trunciseda]|nr:hypothetical protein [Xylographa trunciseda]